MRTAARQNLVIISRGCTAIWGLEETQREDCVKVSKQFIESSQLQIIKGIIILMLEQQLQTKTQLLYQELDQWFQCINI